MITPAGGKANAELKVARRRAAGNHWEIAAPGMFPTDSGEIFLR
jgi:hypothetical protein